MTYFDTAYVLKCYVAEQGSREVRYTAATRRLLAAGPVLGVAGRNVLAGT